MEVQVIVFDKTSRFMINSKEIITLLFSEFKLYRIFKLSLLRDSDNCFTRVETLVNRVFK